MRALFLAVLLVGCSEPVRNAPEAGDVITIPETDWHVVDRGELERVYLDAGMGIPEDRTLLGFAGRRNGRHVVYTLAPKHVGDTCTFGHEMLHIAIGDYHD